MGNLKTLATTAVTSIFTALTPVSTQANPADKGLTAKEARAAFDEKVQLGTTSAAETIENLIDKGAKIKMAPASIKSLEAAKRASPDGRLTGHQVKFEYAIASDKTSSGVGVKPAKLCTGTVKGAVSIDPARPQIFTID